MGIKIDKKFVEKVEGVLEVVSADQGEYSSQTSLSPIDKMILDLFDVDRFKNKAALYDTLADIVINPNGSAADTYGTATYKKLDPDQKEIVSEILENIVDYENNPRAYGRACLMAEKCLGLMTLSDKSLEKLKKEKETFQEQAVWNKMSLETLGNLPQFIKQTEPLQEIMKGMNLRWFKEVYEMMENMNDDQKEKMADLITLSEVAHQFLSMFKFMSEISSNESTLKKKSDFAVDDDEDEEIDEDFMEVLESKIATFVREKIKEVGNKDSKNIASDIIDLIEDEDLNEFHIKNIDKLFSGGHKAVQTGKKYQILGALNTVYHYIDADIDHDERGPISTALLPFAYIAYVTNSTIGDIIDIDYLEEYVDPDADDDYDADDIECDIKSFELEDAITLDYALGGSNATYFYGIYEKEPFYSELARKIIPSISEEYFINKSKSEYGGTKFSRKLVNDVIVEEMKAFGDSVDLITLSADAIYNVLSSED